MATAAQQASLLRAPPEEDDSPILYRSPLAAHSHRLSRASFSSAALAPPPRPERRRPISLRDPPKGRKAVGQAVDEGEDGEGEGDEETYWRGEVQRRPSVGLGLKFGLDGWEIGEDDEGEEGENVVDEAGEGRAMPADSPSDHPLTTLKETHSDSSPPPRSLTPPLSPVSPTSPPRLSTYTTTTTTTSASPSRHRRSDARPSAVLSRYSSSAASQASTAATSIHEEDEGRDDSDVEGKGSPGTRPALGRFTYSTSSRTGLSVPTVPLPPLTPESLTESAAFDFPLPPGMVLPSPSPAMPLVEEPTPLEDDAAASFALTSSPSYSRPSDAQEDEGAQTRLPSYSSTLSPQPQPRSLSSTSSSRSGTSSSGSRGRHLVVSPRPLDPWVLDPAGTDGLDEEDRAILGAVLPMALEAEEEEEEELEDEDDGDMRTMGRSPHLVPLPLSPPQQPTRLYPPSRTAVASGPRTPPNRSPSMPAISPPPSSSSRLGNLFPKSPSFTFGTSPSSAAAPSSSAKASPPLLSPPKSPDTGRNGSSKRSSMLLSPLLAGIGQLGRSRSKSGSNASLSSGGGKGRGLSSVVETASSTRSSSSASSGTRSVTDQLASSRLLSPTSPPASSLAPSLLPAADIDVDLRASSSSRKAAKMLGVDQETVLRSSSSSSLSRSPYGTARSSPAVSPGASPEMGNEPFPRAPPFPSTGRRRPAPLDLLPPAGQAPPGSPARPSPSSVASASKAAKMLGLSEEEVGRAVLSPRGSWEGSRKREEGAQRWPAQREAIREHEIFSGDLYKLSSTPSTLLRQGKLSYRPRVVTLSYAPPLPASTSSPISPFSSPPSNLSSKPSFFLSTYPTPALLEHETSRLTLLPSSHISAPLEGETLPLSRGGRAFALKVTGVVDALANDGSGRVERRKGAWVLGVDDQGVWGEWMGRLRGAVKELQEAAPLPLSGTETPSSASFPYESALPLTPSPPTVSAETFDLDTARLSAAASVRSSTAGKGVAMDFAQTEKAILSSNGWAVTGGPAGAAGSSSTASGSGSGASGLVRSGTTGSTMSRRSQASVGHGSSGSGRGPRSRNPSLAHSTRSALSIAAPSLGSRASSILDLAPYASYVDYAYSSSLRGEEEGDEADQEDFYATEAAERYFFSAASSVREGETSSMREAHSGEQTARVEQLASFLDAESSSDELECGGGGNDGKEEKTALVPLPPLPTQLAAQRPSLSPPPSLLSPRHRTFSASLAPPPLSPPPQTALPPLPPSASRSGSVASLPPATANRRISAAIQFQGSLPASPPPKGGLPALPVVTRA